MKFTTIDELNTYREENGLGFNEMEFHPYTDYVEARVINPENKQKLEYVLLPSEDVEYEIAKMELSLTSQYYDWHDTIADKIARIADDCIIDWQNGINRKFKLDKKDLEEYNRQVEAYNLYGDIDYIQKKDGPEKIIEIIRANSR